jgi:hypothetical protein
MGLFSGSLGTILGGAAGFALGGPTGAAIGAGLGGSLSGGLSPSQQGTQVSTQTSQLDPILRPYVNFGLSEAKKLYETPTPYAPFNTVVAPSSQTLTALGNIENRALAGSSLIPSAQAELQKTISGDYLSGNPFFNNAFKGATRDITNQFNQDIMGIRSKLSSAGRYGSGAQTGLEGRAAEGLATGLSDIGGKLAYQNYGDERTRQANAILNAPTLAEADYLDSAKLLSAGLAREGYTQSEIQDQLARYNYAAPENRLNNYLTGVYGAPRDTTTTSSQPIYGNPLMSALGLGVQGLGVAGLLGYKPFGTTTPAVTG